MGKNLKGIQSHYSSEDDPIDDDKDHTYKVTSDDLETLRFDEKEDTNFGGSKDQGKKVYI